MSSFQAHPQQAEGGQAHPTGLNQDATAPHPLTNKIAVGHGTASTVGVGINHVIANGNVGAANI